VVIEDQPVSNTLQLREKISRNLFDKFGIDHPVLQFETDACGNGSLLCENNCSPINSSDHDKHADDHPVHSNKK